MIDQSKYYFDQDAVDDVISFFEDHVRLTEGRWAGKPFELMQWEQDFITNVFGWKRKSDGLRRYRTAYLEIPKKSGKSPFASGLALYLLCADGEQGAQVYSAAADRNQAGIVFRMARRMVQQSKGLMGVLEPMKSGIWHEATGSIYRVLSRETTTADGINPNGIIIDEVHRHKTRDLIDLLENSTAARLQPLTIYITTAGDSRVSIGWEVHDKAMKVIEGTVVDEEFYAVIYGPGRDEDWTLEENWTDPEIWKRANPALGTIKTMEYMQARCEEAIRSPSKRAAFLRYHLNVWLEQGQQWLDMGTWDACGDPNIALEAMVGDRYFVGLDLMNTRDLCAAAFLFPPASEDDPYVLILRLYMPEDNVKKRHEDAGVPYPQWVTEGYIITTPGDIADYDYIRQDLMQCFDLIGRAPEEIDYDRWNATQLGTQLTDNGLKVFPYSQSIASYSAPMKEAERLLISQEIEHDANPVMRWMVGNVAVKMDADGRIKPDRAKSSEKIDGVPAFLMALGGAIVAEAKDETSVYETRGIHTM